MSLENTNAELAKKEDDLIDVGPEEDTVRDTDDGGAIITMEEGAPAPGTNAHFDNIVDTVNQDRLKEIVTDLLTKIDRDKEAREKRDKLYEEGLRRTGLGDDAPGGAQFTGANKVVHPMLVEACVDFSARFMKEIFPPGGPVKSKIHGTADKEKVEKARRKVDFMNWQTTEQMPEFRGELEQLSTQLPLGGGQYLKLTQNKQRRRPCAEFVPIDDILLPFAATNFYTAGRRTHVQYITALEYDRRVKSGMYADVDIGMPGELEFSKASQANDKIEGRTESAYNEDGLRTVYEVYVYLDIEAEDDNAPYVLTIDKSSSRPLSLYRNWEQDDPLKSELDWIVEFPFVPWRGAYPIGLTHMIGGLSGAATGALRALLDSAHIQNVPTLLKLKGGPGGQTLNVQPTEVVEMEGGAMVDDVRKLAMPLPFAGPSPTLFQLLGFLVDAGKGVVQTSFEKLSDQNPNAPVGTTLALIEQGMVVYSSIHARLHNSMARVFKILHRINASYLTVEDIKAHRAGLEITPEDFRGALDVAPVSDPAIFSEAQRFAQVQAVMQRSQLVPQMYNARAVEAMFIRNLKLDVDEVLQPEPGKADVDPVSENVAATMGRPVYVLPAQDHIAHLKVHLSFLRSPLFGANPAIIKTYLYPMAQHLRDHLLNYYLTEAHRGVKLGVESNSIPDEADDQANLILRIQKLVEDQLGQFGQLLAQVDQQAQQFKPQPPMPPDTSLQVAQLKLQSDNARVAQTAQKDQAELQLKSQELQLEARKLQSDAAATQAELAQRPALEQFRQGAETARTQEEIDARVGMNTADNQTAMRLAAAEIASGERVAVSTGTGINP